MAEQEKVAGIVRRIEAELDDARNSPAAAEERVRFVMFLISVVVVGLCVLFMGKRLLRNALCGV